MRSRALAPSIRKPSSCSPSCCGLIHPGQSSFYGKRFGLGSSGCLFVSRCPSVGSLSTSLRRRRNSWSKSTAGAINSSARPMLGAIASSSAWATGCSGSRPSSSCGSCHSPSLGYAKLCSNRARHRGPAAKYPSCHRAGRRQLGPYRHEDTSTRGRVPVSGGEVCCASAARALRR